MSETIVTSARFFQTHPYSALMHPGGRPAKHPRSTFGARLAQLRERVGISQLQLAQKLGVTQQAVALWERKTNAPRSDTLTKLAQALQVTIEELLSIQAPKPKRAVARGRLQSVFEAAAKLPRRQQEKVAEFVEAFVEHQRSSDS
jgi:transcriptional regulator with XRE-family HTH domain